MIINDNLKIDIETGIISVDREYCYCINQVNYINYAWELTVFCADGPFTIDGEDGATGQYLYSQKKGANQDIQRLKDFGYKIKSV